MRPYIPGGELPSGDTIQSEAYPLDVRLLEKKIAANLKIEGRLAKRDAAYVGTEMNVTFGYK